LVVRLKKGQVGLRGMIWWIDWQKDRGDRGE